MCGTGRKGARYSTLLLMAAAARKSPGNPGLHATFTTGANTHVCPMLSAGTASFTLVWTWATAPSASVGTACQTSLHHHCCWSLHYLQVRPLGQIG